MPALQKEYGSRSRWKRCSLRKCPHMSRMREERESDEGLDEVQSGDYRSRIISHPSRIYRSLGPILARDRI